MSRLTDLLRRLLERWTKPINPPPPKPPPPSGSFAAQLLAEHNITRQAHGLPAYVSSPVLVQLAQKQSEFQAARNHIGHDGPGGSSVWDRLRSAGYQWLAASENAAAGQRTPGEAVEDWVSSTVGHRHNVLGNFTECGGGMAASANGTNYWTVVYATPRSAAALLEEVPAQQANRGWII